MGRRGGSGTRPSRDGSDGCGTTIPPVQSSSPRRSYRHRHDTCRVSALSVNLRRKRHPVIWSHEGLPSDCCAVSAVPRGGALVLSQNLIMYCTQGSQVRPSSPCYIASLFSSNRFRCPRPLPHRLPASSHSSDTPNNNNLPSYISNHHQIVLAINSNAYAGDLPPRLDPAPAPPPLNPLINPAVQAAAAAAAQGAAAQAAARHARQYALNVHPEAAAALARGAPKAPGLELEADGARGTWLGPGAMLLGLKTGQLVVVSLRFDGGSGAATKITVRGRGPGDRPWFCT
jgi:hypothetical protein